MIELGRDFRYVGSQYTIQVGGRDFALHLLFLNRALHCLVAFEIKVVSRTATHSGFPGDPVNLAKLAALIDIPLFKPGIPPSQLTPGSDVVHDGQNDGSARAGGPGVFAAHEAFLVRAVLFTETVVVIA